MNKIVIIISFVLFLAACNEETVNIEQEAVNYDQLQEKIADAEERLEIVNEEFQATSDELKETKDELETNKEEFDELRELAKDREKIEIEISDAESELSSLQSDVDSAEESLSELRGEIKKAAEEPTNLGAGEYVVGDDVLPKRFELTASSGSGNVAIHDSSGSLRMSETIGDSKYGLESYIIQLNMGDTLRLGIPITFTPVE